jgi:hypothetical protein
VFIVLGTILIITSLIPGHVRNDQWDDLFGTGCFLFLIGGLLGLINRMVSKDEDEKLNSYVQRKLARSKSGLPHPHAYDDVESGAGRTRHGGHHHHGHGGHHPGGHGKGNNKGHGKGGGSRFPYNQNKNKGKMSSSASGLGGANNGKNQVSSPVDSERHREAHHQEHAHHDGEANGSSKGGTPTGHSIFFECLLLMKDREPIEKWEKRERDWGCFQS